MSNFLGLGFSFGASDNGLRETLRGLQTDFNSLGKEILGLTRLQTALSAMSFDKLDDLSNKLKGVGSSSLNLTSTLESTFQTNSNAAKKFAVNAGIAAKDVGKFTAKASSMALALNTSADETSKAIYNFDYFKGTLKEIGITSEKTFAEMANIYGIDVGKFGYDLSMVQKNLGLTDKAMAGLISSAQTYGAEAGNIGEVMNSLPEFGDLLTKQKAYFKKSSDEVADFGSQTFILAARMQKLVPNSKEFAMALATSLTDAGKDMSKLLAGVGDAPELIQKMGTVFGVTGDEVMAMIRMGPADFIGTITDKVVQLAQTGGDVGEALDFMRAHMEEALGGDVSAAKFTEAMQKVADEAKAAAAKGQTYTADLSKAAMTAATESAKTNTKALAEGTKAGSQVVRSAQESFELMQQSFTQRIRNRASLSTGEFLKDAQKSFNDFDSILEKASKSSPVGKYMVGMLGDVEKFGVLGLVPKNLTGPMSILGDVTEKLISPLAKLRAAGIDLMSPFGMLTGAVSALGLTFISFKMKGMSVADALEATLNKAGTFVDTVGGLIKDTIKKIIAVLPQVLPGITRFFRDTLPKIGGKVMQAVGDFFRTVLTGAFGGDLGMDAATTALIKDFGASLKEAALKLWDTLGDIANGLMDGLSGKAADAADTNNGHLMGNAIGMWLYRAFDFAIGFVGTYLSGWWSRVVSIWNDPANTFTDKIKKIFISTIPMILAVGVASMLPIFGPLLGVLWGLVKLIMGPVVNALMRFAWTVVKQAVIAVAGFAWNLITGLVPALGSLVWSLLTKTVPAILQFAWRIVATVVPAVASFAWTILSTGIPALFRMSWAVLSSVVPALATFAWTILRTVVGSLWTLATTIFTTGLPAISTFVMNILRGGVGALLTFGSTILTSTLPAIWSFATTMLRSAAGAIWTFVTSIISGGLPALWSFVVALFTETIPAVVGFGVSILTTVIPALWSMAVSFVTGVIPASAGAGTALWTALAPVLPIVLGIVGGIALLVVIGWAMCNWAEGGREVMLGLGLAMLFISGPIGAIILGIYALVEAFKYFQLEGETTGETFERLWVANKAVFFYFLEAIKGGWDETQAAFKMSLENTGIFFKNLFGGIGHWLGRFWDEMKVNTVNIFVSLFNKLLEPINTFKNAVFGMLESILDFASKHDTIAGMLGLSADKVKAMQAFVKEQKKTPAVAMEYAKYDAKLQADFKGEAYKSMDDFRKLKGDAKSRALASLSPEEQARLKGDHKKADALAEAAKPAVPFDMAADAAKGAAPAGTNAVLAVAAPEPEKKGMLGGLMDSAKGMLGKVMPSMPSAGDAGAAPMDPALKAQMEEAQKAADAAKAEADKQQKTATTAMPKMPKMPDLAAVPSEAPTPAGAPVATPDGVLLPTSAPAVGGMPASVDMRSPVSPVDNTSNLVSAINNPTWVTQYMQELRTQHSELMAALKSSPLIKGGAATHR